METPSLKGKPSRKAAAAAVKAHLKIIQGEALSSATSTVLAENPALGGQERRFVAFAVRELSRHMRRLDSVAKALGKAPSEFSLKEDLAIVRYALWRRVFFNENWARIGIEVGLPGPVRPRSVRDEFLKEWVEKSIPEMPFPTEFERLATTYSFPTWLAEKLLASVSPDEAEALLQALNAEPPLFFRMRPLPGSETLVSGLKEAGIEVEAMAEFPDALFVKDDSRAIFDSGPMKRGLLQVMDFGSQLICQLCQPKTGFPKAQVADICAGAGGKTLYLADLVGPEGRVWASDISSKRLEEGKKRLRRANVRNVEFVKTAPLSKADLVLIDAPCSGTGTLAKEPDQKWRTGAQGLKDVVKTQAELLQKTAQALKPGATLVYATCSLLTDENEAQIEAFLAKNGGFKLENAANWLPEKFVRNGYLRVFPHQTPGAGFFAARLVKKD